MFRLSSAALQCLELFVSSLVHVIYGFYIFSTAVAGDVSQSLNGWFHKNKCSDIIRVTEKNSQSLNNSNDLPPIVLVHGIFGFGTGRLGGLSYFAGAEKKDKKVLVPDLGSLTSIYDRPEDGKSLKPLCLLQLCRLGVILYDWFDISWLKEYYNFGFDHYNMTRKKIGLRGLFDCLLGNAGPFATGDWILPDLTIQGSLRLNSHLSTFPDTYYFSYATKRTRSVMGFTIPSGILGIHPLLFIRVLQMCHWCHPSDASPPFKGYRDEEWWDNDGALNTISMTHPRFPVEHPSCPVVNNSEFQNVQPGIWYYKIVEGDHILFIINRERAGVQFDLLYDSIFERCRKHAFRKRTLTLPNQ